MFQHFRNKWKSAGSKTSAVVLVAVLLCAALLPGISGIRIAEASPFSWGSSASFEHGRSVSDSVSVTEDVYGPEGLLPLSELAAVTVTPQQHLISFDSREPASTLLSGQAGAVEPNSMVRAYADPETEVLVHTVEASEEGSFNTYFNNQDLLANLYVTAQAPGKSESESVWIRDAVQPLPGYDAVVGSITDGDTFRLQTPININGQSLDTVRMLNMDTPEVAQAPHGNRATDVLESLLSPGMEVKLELDVEATDAYGRILAHVFRKSDGLDVNEEMLRLGAAVNYYIYPNMKYFEQYAEAVAEAITEGRGIWNPADPLVKLPYEYRSAGCMYRYVGDFRTKEYYVPMRFDEIPVEYRVFFSGNKQDAKNAGYTPADPADPDHDPANDCSSGELMTIEEVRQNWNSNETYRVIGELTAVHAPDHAFIEDETGGIHLYGRIDAGLRIGQEVQVDGNVQEFYGDLEFTNARITVLDQDEIATPMPLELKLNEVSEMNEGSLIIVKNVWITGSYGGGNGGVYITDDTGTRVVLYSPFRDGDFPQSLRDLPRGEDNKFHIIGNSSTWNDTRQIYPRSLEDIVPVDEWNRRGSIVGTVQAQGRQDHSAIEVTAVHQASGWEYSGRVEADGSFSVTTLPAGAYTVTARLAYYFPVVQEGVTVSDEQVTEIGNLSGLENGGTEDGMMRGGDIVVDNVINIYDAVHVGARYGQTSGDVLSQVDINADGKINDADMDLIEVNYLQEAS